MKKCNYQFAIIILKKKKGKKIKDFKKMDRHFDHSVISRDRLRYSQSTWPESPWTVRMILVPVLCTVGIAQRFGVINFFSFFLLLTKPRAHLRILLTCSFSCCCFFLLKYWKRILKNRAIWKERRKVVNRVRHIGNCLLFFVAVERKEEECIESAKKWRKINETKPPINAIH